MMRRVVLLLLGLAIPTWAGADIPLFNTDPRGPVPEEVERFTEGKVEFPAAPKDRDLLRFDPGKPTSLRFYVDAASISVGKDGVVRYTLVIAGDGDARNVTYEGFRCNVEERRVYAYGREDGSWSPAHDPRWTSTGSDLPHKTLARDFLCPLGRPVKSADDGVNALEQGIHPEVESRRAE